MRLCVSDVIGVRTCSCIWFRLPCPAVLWHEVSSDFNSVVDRWEESLPWLGVRSNVCSTSCACDSRDDPAYGSPQVRLFAAYVCAVITHFACVRQQKTGRHVFVIVEPMKVGSGCCVDVVRVLSCAGFWIRMLAQFNGYLCCILAFVPARVDHS